MSSQRDAAAATPASTDRFEDAVRACMHGQPACALAMVEAAMAAPARQRSDPLHIDMVVARAVVLDRIGRASDVAGLITASGMDVARAIFAGTEWRRWIVAWCKLLIKHYAEVGAERGLRICRATLVSLTEHHATPPPELFAALGLIGDLDPRGTRSAIYAYRSAAFYLPDKAWPVLGLAGALQRAERWEELLALIESPAGRRHLGRSAAALRLDALVERTGSDPQGRPGAGMPFLVRSVEFQPVTESASPVRRETFAVLAESLVIGGSFSVVLPDGRLIENGLVVSRDPAKRRGNGFSHAGSRSSALFVGTRRQLPPLAAAVLLGGGPNYAHCLMQWLMRLPSLSAWADLPVLIAADLPASIRQVLREHGVADERIVPVPPDASIRVGRLHVPDLALPSAIDAVPAEHVRWLRESVFGPHRSPARPTRRLYVSRRRARRRRLVNEAEVSALLVRRGFDVVDPCRLGFAEQARLFSEAAVIVGQSGAAMTNLLACQPGTEVLLLHGPVVDGSWMTTLLDVVGIRPTPLRIEGVPGTAAGPLDGDLVLPPALLAAALDENAGRPAGGYPGGQPS